MEAPGALSEKLTTGETFEDEAASDEPKHPAIQIGRRVFMVIMMAWCMLVMLALRGVPSIAMQGTGGIQGMGDQCVVDALGGTHSHCLPRSPVPLLCAYKAPRIRRYNFNNLQKGNINAAWGWAYTLGQMPGGAYAQVYGAKAAWLHWMGLAGASAMLIPTAAALAGPGSAIYAICFMMFISGMGQAPLYPGKEALVGSWIPLSELGFGQVSPL
jgi:MFS family permease